MQGNNSEIEAKLKLLPDNFGIYLMKNAEGDVIYVGKASSLRSRVRSYFQKGSRNTAKVHLMVSNVADIDWILTKNEVEALLLECNLIKKYKPKYNIRLRDDKHYPYLCVTMSELFPRVIVVRRSKQDKNRYFGPYTDALAMRKSLKLIRKIFKIRSCNKKIQADSDDKPCLNLHLNQCEAPCAGRISDVEYAEIVKNMCSFLSGQQEELIDLLEKRMNEASKNLEFEKAAKFRDQEIAIKSILEKQSVISSDMLDRDIIAVIVDNESAFVLLLITRNGKLIGRDNFIMDGIIDESHEQIISEFIKQHYQNASSIPKEILVSHEPLELSAIKNMMRDKYNKSVDIIHPKRGDKYKLLKMAMDNAAENYERDFQLQISSNVSADEDLNELMTILELDGIPNRIEAYDNSNIQGYDAVSSMVVFKKGMPSKSNYRRFKMKMSGRPDDYANMREVITRRLAEHKSGNKRFAELPDLIVIDGGPGQLNSAFESMITMGYNIPMISLAKRFEEIYTIHLKKPILLKRDSNALRLLQRIRDEAHRYAITYHKTIRDKSTRKSILDAIPGIGNEKRKALIKKFGSAAGVKRASIDELITTPGISKVLAQNIYEHFHS